MRRKLLAIENLSSDFYSNKLKLSFSRKWPPCTRGTEVIFAEIKQGMYLIKHLFTWPRYGFTTFNLTKTTALMGSSINTHHFNQPTIPPSTMFVKDHIMYPQPLQTLKSTHKFWAMRPLVNTLFTRLNSSKTHIIRTLSYKTRSGAFRMGSLPLVSTFHLIFIKMK